MNWKIRIKNPVWWVQMILAILTPILAYAGLSAQDLTTWNTLGTLILDALRNPYVLSLVAVSVWNACNDPTSSGVTDSTLVKSYLSVNKK